MKQEPTKIEGNTKIHSEALRHTHNTRKQKETGPWTYLETNGKQVKTHRNMQINLNTFRDKGNTL